MEDLKMDTMLIASVHRSRASLYQICQVADSYARSSFTAIKECVASADHDVVAGGEDCRKKTAEINSCVEKRLATMEGIIDRFVKLRCVKTSSRE